MDSLIIFSIEVLISLGVSMTLILLIRPLLRGVLVETCGTHERADFWLMFTQLMLAIAPLLLVIFFTHSIDESVVLPALFVKDTLFRSLIGVFFGLLLIGHVMWRSVVSSPAHRKAQDNGVAPAR